jgi:hypothetical protein
MSAAEAARDYADSVLAMIPALIDKSVEERRKNACWYELKCEHRLKTCLKVNRWWWRLWMNKHAAKCAANKEMAQACKVAMKAVEDAAGLV